MTPEQQKTLNLMKKSCVTFDLSENEKNEAQRIYQKIQGALEWYQSLNPDERSDKSKIQNELEKIVGKKYFAGMELRDYPTTVPHNLEEDIISKIYLFSSSNNFQEIKATVVIDPKGKITIYETPSYSSYEDFKTNNPEHSDISEDDYESFPIKDVISKNTHLIVEALNIPPSLLSITHNTSLKNLSLFAVNKYFSEDHIQKTIIPELKDDLKENLKHQNIHSKKPK